MGSPPPTRGLLPKNNVRVLLFRITPAHAGTTLHQAPTKASTWDHPRPRGDYFYNPNRTLGTRRITPAHAGTTQESYLHAGREEDHPRPRGDYLDDIFIFWYSWGSPPPTRGLHFYIWYFKMLAVDHPRPRGDYNV